MSADSVDFVCRSLDPLYIHVRVLEDDEEDQIHDIVLRVQCIPLRGMYFGLVSGLNAKFLKTK